METLFKNFTTKTSENPKYQHWFPLKENVRSTRKIRPYLEERSSTDILYRSPMYAIRRLLNEKTPVEIDPEDLSGLYNTP